MPFKTATEVHDLNEHKKILRSDLSKIAAGTPFCHLPKAKLGPKTAEKKTDLVFFGASNKKFARTLKAEQGLQMTEGICKLDAKGLVQLWLDDDKEYRHRGATGFFKLMGVISSFSFQDEDAPPGDTTDPSVPKTEEKPQPPPEDTTKKPEEKQETPSEDTTKKPEKKQETPPDNQPKPTAPPNPPARKPVVAPVFGAQVKTEANRRNLRRRETETQEKQASELSEFSKNLRETGGEFAEQKAETIRQERLGLENRDFQSMLDALEAAEDADPKKRNTLDARLATLEQAALKTLAALPGEEPDKKDQRRREVSKQVLQSVRRQRMAREIAELGPAPWNPEKQAKASDIAARKRIEENGPELLESGAFRPGDQLPPQPKGFPKGSGPAREILAGELAREVMSRSALDLGLPCLQAVTVPGETLSDDPAQAGKPVTGLLRDPSAPEPSKTEKLDPDNLGSVSKDDTQRLAVLDLLTLNSGRTADDLQLVTLTDSDGNETTALRPSGSSGALPDRAALARNRHGMIPPQSLTASLPGARDPFSPELLESIALLNPDEIARGLREKRDALALQHPGLDPASALPDESIEIARRSALFLQMAAKAGLSPADIAAALSTNMEEIFDTPEKEREAGFRAAIRQATERRAALDQLALGGGNPEEETEKYEEIRKKLHALGWCLEIKNAKQMAAWASRNPKELVNLLANRGLRNLAQDDRVEKLLAELDDPELEASISGLSPEKALVRLETAHAAMQERTGDDLWSEKEEKEYQNLGGDAMLLKLGGDPDQLSPRARLKFIEDGLETVKNLMESMGLTFEQREGEVRRTDAAKLRRMENRIAQFPDSSLKQVTLLPLLEIAREKMNALRDFSGELSKIGGAIKQFHAAREEVERDWDALSARGRELAKVVARSSTPATLVLVNQKILERTSDKIIAAMETEDWTRAKLDLRAYADTLNRAELAASR